MNTQNQNSSQESRLLRVLQSSWPTWTPAPVLAHISLQYCRAIRALRKAGWKIQNKVVTVDGKRHGFYRLGPSGSARPTLTTPTPPATDPQAELLLCEGKTIAERKYRDPEEDGHE
jgi:hypothetical protein